MMVDHAEGTEETEDCGSFLRFLRSLCVIPAVEIVRGMHPSNRYAPPASTRTHRRAECSVSPRRGVRSTERPERNHDELAATPAACGAGNRSARGARARRVAAAGSRG